MELHTLPSPTDGQGLALEASAAVWPWRAYVLPTASDPLNSVNISVVLTDEQYSGPVSISVSFDEGDSKTYHVHTTANGVVDLDPLRVPEAKPWSINSPNLHVVSVTLNNATVLERFGLRVFAVDDNSRITLNGEVVKLVGYNHHTQWPDVNNDPTMVTAAPTDEQLVSDITLLLRAGLVHDFYSNSLSLCVSLTVSLSLLSCLCVSVSFSFNARHLSSLSIL